MLPYNTSQRCPGVSPFEIYKTYTGPSAQLAVTFLTRLHDSIITQETNEDIDDVNHPVSRFMQEHGYLYTYIGFIRADHAAGQARTYNTPLTPENFLASVTPDHAILMEAWRLRTLTSGVTKLNNIDFLGLRAIRDEYLENYVQPDHGRTVTGRIFYREPLTGAPRGPRPPVLQNIGFNVHRLRNAVMSVATRLTQGRGFLPGRVNQLPITRDYIRYEGEQSINQWGHDISNKGLALNKEMPKTYYMMLYNELAIRGLLDGTRF